MKDLKKLWSPVQGFEEIRPLSRLDPGRIQPRNERYLRATWGCNLYDPVVAALAEDLGAHELSKKEFAERAYDFRVSLRLTPE